MEKGVPLLSGERKERLLAFLSSQDVSVPADKHEELLLLMHRALSHTSYAHESGHSSYHYQRQEFLGDAVVGLIAAEKEYIELPDASEGILASRTSRLVSGKGLAWIGVEMGMKELILMGKGKTTIEEPSLSIIGDCVEAVIAAIYLVLGLATARGFIIPWFLKSAELIHSQHDYKSTLNEYCQKKYQATPSYHVVHVTGPVHDPLYHIQVIVGDVSLGEATGSGKRIAGQNAAKVGLEILKETKLSSLKKNATGIKKELVNIDKNVSVSSKDVSSYIEKDLVDAGKYISRDPQALGVCIDEDLSCDDEDVKSNKGDYKSKLSAYCQKKYRSTPSYRIVQMTGPDHNPFYHVQVIIDGVPFTEASGPGKRVAEQHASKEALSILLDNDIP